MATPRAGGESPSIASGQARLSPRLARGREEGGAGSSVDLWRTRAAPDQSENWKGRVRWGDDPGPGGGCEAEASLEGWSTITTGRPDEPVTTRATTARPANSAGGGGMAARPEDGAGSLPRTGREGLPRGGSGRAGAATSEADWDAWMESNALSSDIGCDSADEEEEDDDEDEEEAEEDDTAECAWRRD